MTNYISTFFLQEITVLEMTFYFVLYALAVSLVRFSKKRVKIRTLKVTPIGVYNSKRRKAI